MRSPSKIRLVVAQLAAWVAAVGVAVLGLNGYLAGLSFDVALIYLLLLLVAPVCWLSGGRLCRRPGRWLSSACRWIAERPDPSQHRRPGPGAGTWWLAILVGVVSLLMSVWISSRFGDLPPAYHDEYSYLFQAKTFLAGRLWFPSHPTAARLFDQMHVLNEGRFASRYFPATGALIAPFLAIDKPYWGHWLAGALAATFIFWTGRELGGDGVGLLAGLLSAVAPGIGLFSNLLLAHHPTLLGLSLFLFTFLRMWRTKHCSDALLAGIGLSFAMLARPMTAAAVALPAGLWFCWWLCLAETSLPGNSLRIRLKLAVALGIPLLAGLAVIFAYNRAITGNGWKTPYQVFTEVYTPRHVYGFNNVVRGEQRLGPRVLDNYDRWAENLTPKLAARNVVTRLLQSWKWTLGIVPLAMAATVFLLARSRADGRWWLIMAAIVSLHAVHVPYWFVGIMGWHYVFETAPLWALVFAAATQTLLLRWQQAEQAAMPLWWAAITLVALLTSFASFAPFAPSRLESAVDEIAFSRRKYDTFQKAVDRVIASRRALVLIEPDPDDRHIDFVVNDPDLQANVLFGRLRPGTDENEVREILRLFPNRTCYRFRAKSWQFDRLSPNR